MYMMNSLKFKVQSLKLRADLGAGEKFKVQGLKLRADHEATAMSIPRNLGSSGSKIGTQLYT